MNKNYFTVVFKGDVGALPFNPLLKDDTAFGQVESVSRGDVICKRDDEYWELDKTLSMHSGGELKALSELASVTLERDQWREACLAHGEKARAAEAERDQLRAKLAEYEKALEPFAKVAENDIGADEADSDIFRPINQKHAQSPLLRVGHLRNAAAAIRSRKGGDARPSCDGPSSTAVDDQLVPHWKEPGQ